LILPLRVSDVFLVRRHRVEDGIEHARGLAGLYEVAIQLVELHRELVQRFGEIGATLDIGLDSDQHVLHARVGLAAGDDLESLHQWDAG
jgi:hypothetical protein